MKGYLCKNIRKRDEIIFGNYDPEAYMGGIRRFEDLSYETLKQLVDEGFVDVEECHNCSPSIQDMMEFAEKHDKQYLFDGYVVSDKRDDYRVSVDGFKRVGPFETFAEQNEFADFCSEADELDLDYAYAWWD